MNLDIGESLAMGRKVLANREKGCYRPLFDLLTQDEPFAREDQRGEAVGLAAQLAAELGLMR